MEDVILKPGRLYKVSFGRITIGSSDAIILSPNGLVLERCQVSMTGVMRLGSHDLYLYVTPVKQIKLSEIVCKLDYI